VNPIYPGMTVCLGDGGTGRVTDVLVDGQTEQERFIVLSVDGDWGPHRVAPIATVWCVDTQVHVRVTGPEAVALPVCDPVAYGPGHGLRRRMRTMAG
jgi:hypothetical protein